MTLPLLALLLLRASAPGDSIRRETGYRIQAALDESRGSVSGRQTVDYLNATADPLRALLLRIGPGGRIREVRVNGAPVELQAVPGDEGSRFRLELPGPLAPGTRATVTLGFESRPASAPAAGGPPPGRHYDFVDWYPRITAWPGGPAEPAVGPPEHVTEEIASYLVELDLSPDQIIGATGAVVCGDPGWKRASHQPAGKVTLDRARYRRALDAEAQALAAGSRPCPADPPGRRTLVWYAEDVPSFAMALDPEFRYEEGDVFDRPVRVLYRPGSERIWGAGLASGRTESALVWLDESLGSYPWPEVTIVERLAEGGIGLPMLVMRGGPEGAAQAGILRDVARSVLQAMPAATATAEWLASGLASFEATWFFESLGRTGDYERLERRVLDWDLDRLSVPLDRPAARLKSAAQAAAAQSRSELFLHQLRYLLGEDGTRRALGAYARHRFHPVGDDELRAAFESGAGRDLGAAFRQWLHQTVLTDYAVRRAAREPAGDGRWRASVTVQALTAGRFPMLVRVYGGADSATTRLDGLASVETVSLLLPSRPQRVVLDPAARGHDWDLLNNRRGFGFDRGGRPIDLYPGGWLSQRQRRDRMTVGVSPTAWLTDRGGWTFGLRARSDYLGRFAANELWLDLSSGWHGERAYLLNGRFIARNPVWLPVPDVDQTYEAGFIEGRTLVHAGWARRGTRLPGQAEPLHWGVDAAWVTVRDGGMGYLEPGQWDDAATLELTGSVALRRPDWRIEGRATAGTVTDAAPAIARPRYGRGALTLVGRKDLGWRTTARARVFAGATVADEPLPRQRRVFLAGADPYERLASPLLRSRGALFAADLNYHQPGGANVRGLDPDLSARQAYGLGLELERTVFDRSGSGFWRRAAIALFGDGALADGDLAAPGSRSLRGVADGGIGLRLDYRIAATAFQVRLDLPLWVSRPALAQDRSGDRQLGWRWAVSLDPSW